MKKIATTIITIMLMCTLCSCDLPENYDNGELPTNNHWIDRYVDSETGVNYYIYKEGYGGGMTLRVNADGTPYVSKENNQ